MATKEKDIRVASEDRTSTFNLAIGEWLREAREKRGKSIEEAANAIDGSNQAVEDIETGKQSVAGSEFLALIATYEIEPEEVNEFLQPFGLQI